MRKIVSFFQQFGIVLYELLASILFAITVFLTFATETKKRFMFVFVLGVLIFSYMVGVIAMKYANPLYCYAYTSPGSPPNNEINRFLLQKKFDVEVDKKCLEHVYAYAYSQKYLSDVFADPRRYEFYQLRYDELKKELIEKEYEYATQQNEIALKKILRRIFVGAQVVFRLSLTIFNALFFGL
ncbi:hypothetical protein [Thermodesulfovibrio sp.]|uniref:hypothetical protein n=1 Tax=Thermodesulfovibrio sp. TaxID=2067987 RepID=UPI0030B45398